MPQTVDLGIQCCKSLIDRLPYFIKYLANINGGDIWFVLRKIKHAERIKYLSDSPGVQRSLDLLRVEGVPRSYSFGLRISSRVSVKTALLDHCEVGRPRPLVLYQVW